MVDGQPHGWDYGKLWPLRFYTVNHSCGHSYGGAIPSMSKLPEVYDHDYPCHRCYTGPYFNVWD